MAPDALIARARRALLGGVRLSLAEWGALAPEERAAFAEAGEELRLELVALLTDPGARRARAAELDPAGEREAADDDDDDERNGAVLDALEGLIG